jgi:hypothetical protein
MRRKDYWLEIITVTFTALMIMVAVANAQDVAVISTGQSDQIYPVGTHDQPVPTPKPVGLNAARLVVDRSELQFLPSTTRIDFELYQSTDGGVTWQFLGGAGRGGGVSAPFPAGSKNEPRTTSSVTVNAASQEALLKSTIKITGQAYKTNAVVQMWEVK